MKVLIVAANGGFVLGSICTELASCLRDLGHEAPIVGLQNFMRTGRVAVNALRRQPPDLVIGYNFSSILDTTSGGDVFTELGIPNVAWLFDDPFKHYDERAADPRFHERLRRLPRTRFVSWDLGHAERLRAEGIPHVDHLPPGFLGHAYEALLDSEACASTPVCDVGVLGNIANGARHVLLTRLCEEPVNVHAHVGRVEGFTTTPALQRALRPRLMTDAERIRFYRSASIYLETPSNNARTGLNIKCLNAMAAGAFVLAPSSPELHAAFSPDEIATYEPGEEASLLCQVRRYLDDPVERARIAANGRSAVLGRHTMQQRTASLLDTVREWFRAMGRPWPTTREPAARETRPSGIALTDGMSLLH